MFICHDCSKVSEPKEKPVKKVIAWRNVQYANGSKGTEIVKEVNICNECNHNMN